MISQFSSRDMNGNTSKLQFHNKFYVKSVEKFRKNCDRNMHRCMLYLVKPLFLLFDLEHIEVLMQCDWQRLCVKVFAQKENLLFYSCTKCCNATFIFLTAEECCICLTTTKLLLNRTVLII